jgi:UDP-3-O-[3-hydroxymyristoyl] glucosamine N-acyltransferase
MNSIHSILNGYTVEAHGELSLLNQVEQTAFAWSSTANSIALADAPRYFKQACANPNILVIIASQVFAQVPTEKLVLISPDSDALFHQIHNEGFQPSTETPAIIEDSAQVSPQAVIEHNVAIGKNVIIEAGAYIGCNTTIGDECYIGPNVTIGTQALLSKRIQDKPTHIKHVGGVEIKNGVVIHAGANISKAVYQNHNTEIGDFSQIGIGVNVSHDAKIGDCCTLSGGVSITGRAILESNVWVGTGAIVSNWVTVGQGAKIRAGSVVVSDVPVKGDVSGNFATSHKARLKSFVGPQ